MTDDEDDAARAKLLAMVADFHDQLMKQWQSAYHDTVGAHDVIGKSDAEIQEMILRFTIRETINHFFQLCNGDGGDVTKINQSKLLWLLRNITTQIKLLSDGTIQFV